MELLEAAIESRVRTSEEAIPLYAEHLREKGTAERSIETTVWALREFFLEPVMITDLDAERCQAIYDALRTRPRRVQVAGKWIRPEAGKPVSVDTQRGMLRQARSLLRWCVAKKWITENPLEEVQGVGRTRPRGKSLGKEGRRIRIREARALYLKALELAQTGNKPAAVVLTAILLGLRASEIVRLRVRDLDAEELEGDVLHVENRKNGEDLELEVPDVLRPILVAFAAGRDAEAYLFAHKTGKPYRRWYVLESVHQICDAAGVPRITAHACRGLLATVAAERGMAGHLIAQTLGNDERVMAGHYAAPGAIEAGGRRRGLAVLQGGRR